MVIPRDVKNIRGGSYVLMFVNFRHTGFEVMINYSRTDI